jgi:RNA polymerase sigma-70 factor (ECF subfamily)
LGGILLLSRLISCREADRATGRSPLATEKELATFLAEVERRAFKQAVFAVRDEHLALDLVQDAMLKLAQSYGAKPAAELPLLFQRILQNTIRDHYRRQKVRSLWTTLLSSLQGKHDEEEHDPLDTLVVEPSPGIYGEPGSELARRQVTDLIEQGLQALPARQREAFLLRYWEELDVQETAKAMGCSEGSVKTHCSRATHALSAFLKARGIEL